MGRIPAGIPKKLLTVTGDMIVASAPATPARLAAVAVGQDMKSQGAGVVPAYGADAPSAVTRAGGNTVEATTTSTAVVDLISVTGLSIVAGVPLDFWAVIRKTAGAAASVRLGLKVNATDVYGTDTVTFFSTVDQAESGLLRISLFANVANYLGAGLLRGQSTYPGSGSTFGITTALTRDALLPAATITSLTIRGLTVDAAVTVGTDEAQVYTYAVS